MPLHYNYNFKITVQPADTPGLNKGIILNDSWLANNWIVFGWRWNSECFHHCISTSKPHSTGAGLMFSKQWPQFHGAQIKMPTLALMEWSCASAGCGTVHSLRRSLLPAVTLPAFSVQTIQNVTCSQSSYKSYSYIILHTYWLTNPNWWPLAFGCLQPDIQSLWIPIRLSIFGWLVV